VKVYIDQILFWVFAGVEGVVVKVKGNQVSLRIESLQTRLSMTVPRHILSRFQPLSQE